MAIFAGELLLDGELKKGWLEVQGHQVTSIDFGPPPQNAIRAHIVSPGFIDLQVNGAFGHEADGGDAMLSALAAALPQTGVTAFLPTMVSGDLAAYWRFFESFARCAQAPGAWMPGLHLEGPYLSHRRMGAHPPAGIRDAAMVPLDALLERGNIRMMTLAPELPQSLARIEKLVSHGVLVSLGHTDASAEQLLAGVDSGAKMVTHLYNAMSGFQHRSPGAVGAALVDDRITVGLIADGVHSHPLAMTLAFRAKTARRVALVTDSMAAAGMPPGQYALAGQPITVDAHSARLADGTLAGSILTMDEAIRRTVILAGVTLGKALHSATAVPAALLGESKKGRLAVGCDADLVLLGPSLSVEQTYVRGQRVYAKD